ncbi:MAG: hypothetical protein LC098_12250 [Burkholderiales bacterium]|nr:hypothetical protein [Burkholderiales bacterium]
MSRSNECHARFHDGGVAHLSTPGVERTEARITFSYADGGRNAGADTTTNIEHVKDNLLVVIVVVGLFLASLWVNTFAGFGIKVANLCHG